MGLETVELVMHVEEEFQIELSDAEAEKIQTPRMLIATIENKTGRPRAEIAAAIRKILIECFGIKEYEYFEDADFIRDLRMG